MVMSPWPHFLAHPVCDSCCVLNNKLAGHLKIYIVLHFVCLSRRAREDFPATLKIMTTGNDSEQLTFHSFLCSFSRPPRRHGPDHTHGQSPYMLRSNEPSGLSETRVWSGPVRSCRVRSGPCSGIYYNPCDRQTDMRTDLAYTVASHA